MKTQKDTNPLVRAYTPAWRPPNASLAGMVVVIDPAGGGSDSDDGRRVDDLAVMTGAVLFHFVQQAGGIPIMTRADDNRRFNGPSCEKGSSSPLNNRIGIIRAPVLRRSLFRSPSN
jgi:N-acetylmuramoyl-L-alanine amidase